MIKIYFLFLIFSPVFVFTQILDRFPQNQTPYIGGYQAYYKDFHDIIAGENLQPCENKSEFYQFSVLINTDGTINFVKDMHENYLAANKCASELARAVAKKMTKWNPAKVDGIKQPAVATFMISPDDLFKSDKTDYSPSITYPRYNSYEENHLDYFKKQLLANLNLRRFDWNDRFTVEAEFIISKEGTIKDIVLTKKTGLEEFDRMVFYAFKDMKKKWKPATINGQPIDFRFKYQLTAITDPKD